jgi:hypothetical protein
MKGCSWFVLVFECQSLNLNVDLSDWTSLFLTGWMGRKSMSKAVRSFEANAMDI